MQQGPRAEQQEVSDGVPSRQIERSQDLYHPEIVSSGDYSGGGLKAAGEKDCYTFVGRQEDGIQSENHGVFRQRKRRTNRQAERGGERGKERKRKLLGRK